MKCNKCNTENVEGAKFCQECGAPLTPNEPMKCPKCGAQTPEGAKYCQECGAPLVPEQTVSTTPQKKQKKKEKSGLIIAGWAGALLLMSFFSLINEFILKRLIEPWMITFIIQTIIVLAISIINFIPIFYIKKKWLKITGFLLMGLVLILTIIIQIIILIRLLQFGI